MKNTILIAIVALAVIILVYWGIKTWQETQAARLQIERDRMLAQVGAGAGSSSGILDSIDSLKDVFAGIGGLFKKKPSQPSNTSTPPYNPWDLQSPEDTSNMT